MQKPHFVLFYPNDLEDSFVSDFDISTAVLYGIDWNKR